MNRRYLYFLLFVFLYACKTNPRKLPYYNTSDFTPVWKLPSGGKFHTIRPFELTDQEGKAFTEKGMDNKICIADFFFASCPGICPRMTKNMGLLQQEFLKDEHILLLSHTVTPAQDSVPILAKYAKQKGVDYNKWKLLTGAQNEIYDLGRRSYFVEEDLGEKRDSSVFLHTENFVLIDKNRIIRGIYNGLDASSISSLMEDIKLLEQE